jgi:hypothetical protein
VPWQQVFPVPFVFGVKASSERFGMERIHLSVRECTSPSVVRGHPAIISVTSSAPPKASEREWLHRDRSFGKTVRSWAPTIKCLTSPPSTRRANLG